MNEKEFKSNQCESEFASPVAQEPYTAPKIEVIDIELGQNILGGGSTEDLPGGGMW